MMGERVVVGVNGKPAGEAALAWALEYARPRRLDVELVHVVEEGRAARPRDVTASVLLEAENQLRTEAERARAQVPGMLVHPAISVGSPVDELTSRSASAALLVIGTHRTERFGRSVYGTRAAQIAAHASCPVVVVPDDRDTGGSGVVVGVDGTSASQRAVEFAAREADRHGEPLTAVYSWWVPQPWTSELDSPDYSRDSQEADRLVLSESVAGLAELYPDLVVTLDVNSAPPVDALVAAAPNARLLVVGSHGRRGIRRLLLGSVSHDVLLGMPCPVAVLPMAG